MPYLRAHGLHHMNFQPILVVQQKSIEQKRQVIIYSLGF